jgi:hypothetical protein
VEMLRDGVWIMTLLAGLAFGSIAEAATAATAAKPDCRALEVTGERLACYDAAYPPIAKKPAVVAPAAVDNAAPHATYKDPFLAEEARTAAKLRTICRGC